MSTRPLPSVVLFVTIVERVASFYKGLASMQFVAGDSEHAVLEIEGFQLVVHRLKGEPEPVQDSLSKVRVREDSYSKLCVPVQSINTVLVPKILTTSIPEILATPA
jgi:hypothetical protein